MSDKLKLGITCEDIVTGFTGTLTGRAEYLTGCAQYFVVPQCKDKEFDKYPEGQWLDEHRLTVVDHNVLKLNPSTDDGPCGVAPKY